MVVNGAEVASTWFSWQSTRGALPGSGAPLPSQLHQHAPTRRSFLLVSHRMLHGALPHGALEDAERRLQGRLRDDRPVAPRLPLLVDVRPVVDGGDERAAVVGGLEPVAV